MSSQFYQLFEKKFDSYGKALSEVINTYGLMQKDIADKIAEKQPVAAMRPAFFMCLIYNMYYIFCSVCNMYATGYPISTIRTFLVEVK